MKYLLVLFLFFPSSVLATENITINGNKFCADVVEIPYASDNFTDVEWEKFQQCLRMLNDYEVP